MAMFWEVVVLFVGSSVMYMRMASGDYVSKGQVHPMAFCNITTDKREEGFVQVYAYSVNDTQIKVEASANSVNEFSTVGTRIQNHLNITLDFDEANFASAVLLYESTEIDQLGIITASNFEADFFGVKSDRGSTDAFRALPLMRKSTQFFVAVWPYSPPFYASCVIVPALSGTCVEIYKIFANQTYLLVGEGSLSQFDTLRYYADNDVDMFGNTIPDSKADMTGYFINATKPVQVICAHECAHVPEGVPFCDHISEQIPPINQLGKFHVVPPIYGRSPNAGYVVRVVATEMNTAITSMGVTVVRDKGSFAQFNTSSFRSIVVECDKPCLVMQYNKGRRAVTPADIPTDPFMTLTIPSDRFTRAVGFATPNYCDVAKVRVVFDNWLTVVTFAAYRENIIFDGQSLSNLSNWDLTSVPGYAIISFQISHDFHYLSIAPERYGSFAAYSYGHSIIGTSSSAYGVALNYNITGDPVTDVWEQSQEAFNQYLDSLKNATCSNESLLINPILSEVDYASFPFTLSASFDPVSISDSCILNFYNPTIWKQLTDFTHMINQWICSTANCSYLQGWGVALNYKTLDVQFLKDSRGNYNGLYISVEMISSLETTASEFGACRTQIKNFMTPFVNWPSRTLFSSRGPPGCPWPLNFYQQEFTVGGLSCYAD